MDGSFPSFPCLAYHCMTDAGSLATWMYLLVTFASVNAQTGTGSMGAGAVDGAADAVFAPTYKHYRQLDPAGNYLLAWTANETDIDLEVTVRTTGYVGLGLSPTGLMASSDMMIGWIFNGSIFLGVSS